jgi:hypothetical protein
MPETLPQTRSLANLTIPAEARQWLGDVEIRDADIHVKT